MKRVLILGICFGLITFLLLACTTATQKGTEKKKEVKTVKVNEDLQVGEVQWRVLSVGEMEPTSQYYRKVRIELGAELLAKESETVHSEWFAITDSKNRNFKPTSETVEGFSLAEGSFNFTNFDFYELRPNIPIKGYIIFEVAKDSRELKLKIKDTRDDSTEYGLVDLGI